MSAVEALIDRLYETTTRPETWEEVIGGIAGFFHAATGVLYTEERDLDRFRLLDPIAVFGHSPSAIASYADYYGGLNPFNNCSVQSQRGVLTEASLEAQRGGTMCFGETEYYYDWVRPQGIRHVVGQRLRFSGDKILTVAFWRPADVGAYREEEIAAQERICRHIDRTLDIGARLRMAEAEMETVLGRMSAAVLTLGRDGRVRQVNVVAGKLLANGRVLRSENGRLRTAIPQDQAALDRLIAGALDGRNAARAESARVALRAEHGGPALTARIVAVAQRFDPFAPDRPASAILMVEGYEGASENLREHLRRRFGLTPAQTRVAMEIREGRSVAATAEALTLSPETVRTHLKALFARTGTHRQAELTILLRGEAGD